MMRERPDKYLLELPSRYCEPCGQYRIFSSDGTFCLTCGKYRHDPFNPPSPQEEEKTRKEEIISLLGEGFHTAFRKAIPDSDIGDQIWYLIRDLHPEDWGAVLEFVYGGMEHIFTVVTKPRGELKEDASTREDEEEC